MSRHIYTLKKPASWYGEKWREALPLGNGLTGVLIPGAVAEDSIHHRERVRLPPTGFCVPGQRYHRDPHERRPSFYL